MGYLIRMLLAVSLVVLLSHRQGMAGDSKETAPSKSKDTSPR